MTTMRIASFGPMERVVRPFVAPRVLALDRVPPPPKPDPDTPEIVHARWGGEGNASFNVRGSPAPPPDPEPDPEPDPSVVIDFEEVAREEELIRVENPADAAQYVMVADILNITFRPPAALKRPPEELWRYVLHKPEP